MRSRHLIRHLIVILVASLLANSMVFAGEVPCESQSSKQIVTGPSPLTSQLKESVRQAAPDVFFPAGQFSVETFSYVGQVRVENSSWHVALLLTIWGQSCRSTARLIVLSESQQYLGQYSHFTVTPSGVEGSAVVFSGAEHEGRSIVFTISGPPASALIDGNILTFYR